jgi:hypothetical protein
MAYEEEKRAPVLRGGGERRGDTYLGRTHPQRQDQTHPQQHNKGPRESDVGYLRYNHSSGSTPSDSSPVVKLADGSERIGCAAEGRQARGASSSRAACPRRGVGQRATGNGPG